MLQHSKFVNNKSNSKNLAKTSSQELQAPIFSEITKKIRDSRTSFVEKEIEVETKVVELKSPHKLEYIENNQYDLDLKIDETESNSSTINRIIKTIPEEKTTETQDFTNQNSVKQEPKIHGAINFNLMQEIEEKNKTDEDWLSFFLGSGTSTINSKDRNTNFDSNYLDNGFAAEKCIITPKIQSEIANNSLESAADQLINQYTYKDNSDVHRLCLEDLFGEMIAEDKVFAVKSQN